MFNRKYYSFERNNYYYGKLLASKDFQREQGYMNDKRRLINRTLHGFGVVYGMDVVATDDSSIVLQSGMALDAGGREIVVPKTQVLKLSTIEGYSSLKTDSVCLGIAYEEEPADPVYAVMETEGDGKKYNHIKEGYKLFLCDYNDCTRIEKEEDAFISGRILYQDEDICVTQYLPTFIVPNMLIKGRTEIRKCSHIPNVCTFSCRVAAEGLVEKETEIRADNLNLEYGNVLVLEQTFRAEEYVFGDETIEMEFKEIELQKSGQKETTENTVFKVTPVMGTVLDYVNSNCYKDALDVELDKKYDEKLWIARIQLIRSGNASLIDSIERVPFGQYVCNTQQLMNLEKLHEFIVAPAAENTSEGLKPMANRVVDGGAASYEKRTNSSGVFEMSLGTSGEIGKVYFSDEIMHGLGNGPVYVEIGVEYISKDAGTKSDKESIILGDGSIFASDNSLTEDKVFQMDQAVKILPDRGTFVVGVRPKVKMGKIGLRIRWYAFKPEDLEKRVYNIKEQNGCIMVQPDTIVLPPKGSVHIKPVFINMPEEALSYTLLDPEGGKINNNGVYTAPAQEGVYEVKLAALSNPDIFTHAFIIVSQKKVEE